MIKRNTLLLLIFCFTTLTLSSQNEENRWAITIGSGSVLYSQEDGADIGYRYNTQFPRLSIGLYSFKNLTLVASISSSLDGSKKYTTIDGEARYDFGTSSNRLSPYIVLGGSLIDAKRQLPTVNFGAGVTLWITEKLGLNGQLMHKYNEERFQSQRSHTFGSLGLIFRFSLASSGNGNIIKDSRKKRIWD